MPGRLTGSGTAGRSSVERKQGKKSVKTQDEMRERAPTHLPVPLGAPSSDLADVRPALLFGLGLRQAVLDRVSDVKVALSDLKVVLESVLLLIRLVASRRRTVEELLVGAWRRGDAAWVGEVGDDGTAGRRRDGRNGRSDGRASAGREREGRSGPGKEERGRDGRGRVARLGKPDGGGPARRAVAGLVALVPGRVRLEVHRLDVVAVGRGSDGRRRRQGDMDVLVLSTGSRVRQRRQQVIQETEEGQHDSGLVVTWTYVLQEVVH